MSHVICTNCEGSGCDDCRFVRLAVEMGEQGPTALELEVCWLRDRVQCLESARRIAEETAARTQREVQELREQLLQALTALAVAVRGVA